MSCQGGRQQKRQGGEADQPKRRPQVWQIEEGTKLRFVATNSTATLDTPQILHRPHLHKILRVNSRNQSNSPWQTFLQLPDYIYFRLERAGISECREGWMLKFESCTQLNLFTCKSLENKNHVQPVSYRKGQQVICPAAIVYISGTNELSIFGGGDTW